jgi:hypothetical protein
MLGRRVSPKQAAVAAVLCVGLVAALVAIGPGAVQDMKERSRVNGITRDTKAEFQAVVDKAESILDEFEAHVDEVGQGKDSIAGSVMERRANELRGTVAQLSEITIPAEAELVFQDTSSLERLQYYYGLCALNMESQAYITRTGDFQGAIASGYGPPSHLQENRETVHAILRQWELKP